MRKFHWWHQRTTETRP